MLYTAALLSAAMLLAGCYSTDTDDDLLSTATLISIYPSTVSVGSAAATQNVVVTLAPKSKRNLDWSCSVQSAWVTAVREKVPGESTGTVYEDAVVLAFLENTAYKRQTTLTITASDGTVLEVPVVQKGIYADAYVKAAPESLTFMAENPQPAAVAIDTNMDTFAAVSDSDWCTVVDNGDGTISYCKNNTITENVYIYYNKYQWVRDNTKANTFSTDFLKLKEVRLDYRFPERWMQKTKFLRSASIGVFATNLFCITNWPQYDPEAAGVVSGTNIYGGIETGSFPMTRTYGFNIKLQF